MTSKTFEGYVHKLDKIDDYDIAIIPAKLQKTKDDSYASEVSPHVSRFIKASTGRLTREFDDLLGKKVRVTIEVLE